MSEEKKTVELKEEELEKTSGGYAEETVYSFNEGDCFSDNRHIYKVLDYYEKMGKNDNVKCKWFRKDLWIDRQDRFIVRENADVKVRILLECNYEGVDYI